MPPVQHAALPTQVVGLLQLGIARQRANRPEEARDILEDALALAPRERDVLRPLAATYLALGDTKEARSLARRVRDLAPRDASVGVLMAQAYKRDGSYAKALHQIKQTCRLNPFDTEAWVLRGDILSAMNAYKRASKAYSTVLEDAPNDVKALSGRAFARLERNYLHDAGDDVAHALALDPNNALALQTKVILRRLGISEAHLTRSPAEVAWDSIERLYLDARLSESARRKADYLEAFNASFARALPHEGAAFERLAKLHAYLAMQPGQILAFDVRYHLRAHPAHATPNARQVSYASEYIVHAALLEGGSSVQAYLLMPRRTYAQAIIVFRGTSPRRWQDRAARAMGVTTGFVADVDLSGIGRADFKRQAPVIADWVDEAIHRQAGVTFVGHSLGGALATRAYIAAHRQHRRDRALFRLVTFNAPAVDRATARGIHQRPHQVFHFITSDDIVHRAGERHLEGTVLRYRGTGPALCNVLANHTQAPLSDALLARRLGVGGSLIGTDVGLEVLESHEKISRKLEVLRLGVGWFVRAIGIAR